MRDLRRKSMVAHPDRWVSIKCIPDDRIKQMPVNDETIATTMKLGVYYKQLAKDKNLKKVIIESVDQLDDLGLDMPIYWGNDSSYTLAWVVKREILRKEDGWFDRKIVNKEMHHYGTLLSL